MRALGIINFENSNANVEGLSDYRPVPAMAFMGRYRVIDFVLSNMLQTARAIQSPVTPRSIFIHIYCLK